MPVCILQATTKAAVETTVKTTVETTAEPVATTTAAPGVPSKHFFHVVSLGSYKLNS